MKKLLLSIVIILGFSLVSQAQHVLLSLTTKNDGYVTVGFVSRMGIGLYAGTQYNAGGLANQIKTVAKGSIPVNTSYGIIKMLANDKVYIGGGVKEKENHKYSNFIVGFAPLKNERSTKLWLTSEITGGKIFAGAGVSYKIN